MELFLGGDRNDSSFTPSNHTGDTGAFQILSDVLGDQYTLGAGMSNANWSVQAGLIPGGYAMEFDIPLSLINTVNAPGSAQAGPGSLLKFNVGTGDADVYGGAARYGVLWKLGQYYSPYVAGEPSWVADLYLDNGQPSNSTAPLLVDAPHVTSSPSFNALLGGDGTTTGNVVQGNRIGTDATGANPLGNAGNGVSLKNGASNNVIGGTGVGANTIAFNAGAGVVVTEATSTGDIIRGNSIESNGALGIDLGADGVTPNHVGSTSGPNNLQNYPVLTQIQSIGSTTEIVGSLNGLTSTTYTLDFYASAEADLTGYGQGQRYLGTATVTTDGSGNASFDVTLSASTAVGELISATATDPSGDTSEFSAVGAVTDPPSSPALQASATQLPLARPSSYGPTVFAVAPTSLPDPLASRPPRSNRTGRAGKPQVIPQRERTLVAQKAAAPALAVDLALESWRTPSLRPEPDKTGGENR